MPNERSTQFKNEFEKSESAKKLYEDLKVIAERVVGGGKRLVFILTVTEISFHVPDRVGASLALGLEAPRGPSVAEVLKRRFRSVDAIYRVASATGALVIDPIEIFCADRCALTKDGCALYFDHHHLSIHAASLVEMMLEKHIPGAFRP